MRRAALLLAVVAACGGGSSSPDAGGDAYVPSQSRALGMNDVTILLRRPASPSAPVMMTIAGPAGGAPLVTSALYDRIANAGSDVATPYADFHLIAIRFDLCDRGQPGPCPIGVDGVVRLVLQPILADGTVFDLALHAFYPIPAGD